MWVRSAIYLLCFPARSNFACVDVDEQSKKEIKDILVSYDRSLLVQGTLILYMCARDGDGFFWCSQTPLFRSLA
jgi:hypothetical protein